MIRRLPWSTLIPRLITVLAPIGIIGGVTGWMAVAEPTAIDGDGTQNAGRVMNGRRLKRSVIERMESDLETYAPEVLILGSSYAHTNIAPKEVARRLGIPRNKVLVFSVPNSVTSHWYTTLDHRVYDNDHQVPLVIIVGSLRALLVAEPYSPASRDNLLVHLEAEEPVLDRFVQRDAPIVARMRRNRTTTRDDWILGLGLATAPVVFPGDESFSLTNRAMGRVFHDSNLDHANHRSMMPIQGGSEVLLSQDAGELPTPATSLIPELTRLAADHGTTVVFVRTPMAPRTPLARQDTVPAGTEAQVDELFTAEGHLFLDLWRHRMPGRAFEDLKHMHPDGALAFTGEILDRIDGAGIALASSP